MRPSLWFIAGVAAFIALSVSLRFVPGLPPVAADAAGFLALALLLKPLVARQRGSAAWAASAVAATAVFAALEWFLRRLT